MRIKLPNTDTGRRGQIADVLRCFISNARPAHDVRRGQAGVALVATVLLLTAAAGMVSGMMAITGAGNRMSAGLDRGASLETFVQGVAALCPTLVDAGLGNGDVANMTCDDLQSSGDWAARCEPFSTGTGGSPSFGGGNGDQWVILAGTGAGTASREIQAAMQINSGNVPVWFMDRALGGGDPIPDVTVQNRDFVAMIDIDPIHAASGGDFGSEFAGETFEGGGGECFPRVSTRCVVAGAQWSRISGNFPTGYAELLQQDRVEFASQVYDQCGEG